jgi:hypothetical protein
MFSPSTDWSDQKSVDSQSLKRIDALKSRHLCITASNNKSSFNWCSVRIISMRSTWTRYRCYKLDFNSLWQVQNSPSHYYGIQHGVECAFHSIPQHLCSHVVPRLSALQPREPSLFLLPQVGGYPHPTDSHYLLLGISQLPGRPKVCRLP